MADESKTQQSVSGWYATCEGFQRFNNQPEHSVMKQAVDFEECLKDSPSFRWEIRCGSASMTRGRIFRRRGVHFQLFWVVITRYEVGLQRLCSFLKFGGFIQWILCLLHFQLLEGSIFEESNSTAMRAIGTARPSFFVTSWFCNFPTRSRRRFCTIIFAMWIPAHLVLYCAFFYLLVR